MRYLLALMMMTACGGPTHSQVIEAPSATARARPNLAPPASTSDKDRERLVQQFEDMETTQRAYREADEEARNADPTQGYVPPGSGRKAPVEQAPVEPPPPLDAPSQAPGNTPPR